tara:strand:+ start:9285 stop:9599 length:315 start_codon:yes stop_codon:yes gene_type:complete
MANFAYQAAAKKMGLQMRGVDRGVEQAIGRTNMHYNPQSNSTMNIGMQVRNHAMLGRRLHSGDLNMINRRRRVQPRQLGGAPRLSFRNTQPNKGTYGIGRGLNR